MDMRKLEYLLKVAEVQSITEAARQLYVTQPALSQVIAALEKKYQMKIFERRGGFLHLTREGEVLIATARKQLLLESDFLRELSDIHNEESGTLRIGMSVNRAILVLPAVVPKLQEEYPKIQLDVNTRSFLGFEKMVAEGKLDMAFVMDAADVEPQIHSQLVYEPLMRYTCLLAVPPRHPLAEQTAGIFDWRLRPPVDLNLVKDDPFIGTPVKKRSLKWLSSVYEAYDFYPKTVITIGGSCQYSLVQAGVGCALLQDTIAFAQKSGAFFRLDKGDFATNLCAIYRKGAYQTRAAVRFLELIRECAKDGIWNQI